MTKKVQNKSAILLADASKFFLSIEKQFLHKIPVEIHEATSARETLALCAKLKLDLIYLAEDLADQPGGECCRQLKDHPESGKTPVTALERPVLSWKRPALGAR